MARRLKLLTSLSTVALTSALALSACGSEGEGAEGESEGDKVAAVGAESAAVAGAESESGESEGGESEGGESEGTGSPEIESSNRVYLQQLALVRGHLFAARALYKADVKDQASMHIKHPESELYTELVPAFAVREKPGFEEALRSLVSAFDADTEFEAVYEATVHAIEDNAPEISVKDQLLTIASVVTIAADELKLARDEAGAITNLHEYQDAYGFVSVAQEMAASIDPANQNEVVALEAVNAQLEEVLAGFDGWTPTQVKLPASQLYGAAARIEIAALGL